MKLRKILKQLLILGFVVCLTACGGTENKKDKGEKGNEIYSDESLEKLMSVIDETDSVCGAAFLGYFQGGYEDLSEYLSGNGYLNTYTFLDDISEAAFIEAEGDELYCIVPAKGTADILVNEFSIDFEESFEGEIGDNLYKGKGEPVLIKGNISSNIPNIIVTIKGENGEKLSYNPFLRLDEEILFVPEEDRHLVYDFSLYDILEGNESENIEYFIGDWTAYYVIDGNGNEMVCMLEMHENGDMMYAYGEPYSPFLEYFTGTWSITPDDPMAQYPPGLFVFSMYPSSESLESDIETGLHEFWGLYEISEVPYDDECISVKHIEGNTLIYGAEEQNIKFIKSMG